MNDKVGKESSLSEPSSLRALAAKLNALEEQIQKAGSDASEPLAEAVLGIKEQLSAVESETRELSSYTEQALGQAEKLKKENEELRKAKEEAVIEGQLAKKLGETEKLTTATSTYKKDLLQKNLAQKEQEVMLANDKLKAAERQIKGLSSQLSEVRRAHRESTAELEDLKDKKSSDAASQTDGLRGASKKAAAEEAEQLAAAEKEGLGNEHEALAARLLDGGLEKLDSVTIAAAAAGLRDTSVLEKQLKRARTENERLQKEIQQLNDTVFSKSFKPPSAWADREVKYKMEKRDWQQQISSLRDQIKTLTDENQGYRELNKAEEFEKQIKELKGSVKKAEAETTAAQQALHEMQLQMREVTLQTASSRRTELAPEDANVHNLISAMEEHGIGVQQPRPQGQRPEHKQISAVRPIARSGSSGSIEAFPAVGANLQELIEDYDDQGIGMAGVFSKKKSFRRKPDAFTHRADIRSSDASGDNVSVDLNTIKDGLRRDASRSTVPGSDAESDSGPAHRRTWSADQPEAPAAPAPSGGEPSRLQHARRGEDAAEALTFPTKQAALDLPDEKPAQSHDTAASGRGNRELTSNLGPAPPTEEALGPDVRAHSGRLEPQAGDDLQRASKPPRDVQVSAAKAADAGARSTAAEAAVEGRDVASGSEVGGRSLEATFKGVESSKAPSSDRRISEAATMQNSAAGGSPAAPRPAGEAPGSATISEVVGHDLSSGVEVGGHGLTSDLLGDDVSVLPDDEAAEAELATKTAGKQPAAPKQEGGAQGSAAASAELSHEFTLGKSHDGQMEGGGDPGAILGDSHSLLVSEATEGEPVSTANSSQRQQASPGAEAALLGPAGTAASEGHGSSSYPVVGGPPSALAKGAEGHTPEAGDETAQRGQTRAIPNPAAAPEGLNDSVSESRWTDEDGVAFQGQAELPDQGSTEPRIKPTTLSPQESPAAVREQEAGTWEQPAVSEATTTTRPEPSLRAASDHQRDPQRAEGSSRGVAEAERDGAQVQLQAADPLGSPSGGAQQAVGFEEAAFQGQPAQDLRSSASTDGAVSVGGREAQLLAKPPAQKGRASTPGGGHLLAPVPGRDGDRGLLPEGFISDSDAVNSDTATGGGGSSLALQESPASDKQAGLETRAGQKGPGSAASTHLPIIESAFTEIEPLNEGLDLPLVQRIRVGSDNGAQPNGQGMARSASRFMSRNSSESDSPWTLEKLDALQEEKQTAEAQWREHMAEQDAGTLKYRAAEMESRVEMHKAQIQKMSLALEVADEEKARLEEDLEVAMRAASGGKSLDSSDEKSLDAIRDRMQKMVAPDTLSSAHKLKETEGALQQAYREMQVLSRQKDELQKQLAGIASKINSGIIPDPDELDLPQSMQDSEGQLPGQPDESGSVGMSLNILGESAKRSRSFKAFIGGFADEEIEVMGLRHENENMMDTLVRTKVELAETQGDYLKMRRALIRAVEKQAALADRLESLSEAYSDGNMEAVDELIRGIFQPPQAHSGDIESLGERERF